MNTLPDGLPEILLAAELDSYRDDWWAHSLMRRRRGTPKPLPLAALLPRSRQEVSEIMRWASENRVAVVPRGGGSGVCGGAEPGGSSVVIDLTNMESVTDLDDHSMTVEAQAGISGPRLERSLNDRGLTLGHWPQSFHLSTLGGWVSTKAAGQLSTLYGNIEDRILGLTVVLADGSIVSSKPSPRSSTGSDWWRLFIGAEGTLGVVTDVALSVFRSPESAVWMGIEFDSFEQGIDLMREIFQVGLRPAVARLYDAPDAALSLGRDAVTAIIRLEGTEAMVAANTDEIAAMASLEGGPVIGPEAGERWWGHRFEAADRYRSVLSGDGPLGRHAVLDTMEVSAFWRDLHSAYLRIKAALEDSGAVVMTHASHMYTSGSGLYFTFIADGGSDDGAEGLYSDLWGAGMRAALESGASISHHHGIGLLKAPWTGDEQGTGIEGLRRLKRAFDPDGIMNPGKAGL